MQGFNKYYAPDYFESNDYKNKSLNNFNGKKHGLGDRARKIKDGILITRFELPFNIWCDGCNNHIGMGVRYNAEKKKVGMYYSTPIYSFRCKCHLCDNWFEVRTDPKNTRYVVENGARQKNEEWDESENCGIVLNRKDDSEPVDPFKKLEDQSKDKQRALESKDRLEELMEFSETRNSDPFALSQKLRKSFRKEKSDLIDSSRKDDQLRSKYSLPSNLRFEDDNLIDRSIKDEIEDETRRARTSMNSIRSELRSKRIRDEAETGSIVQRPRNSQASCSSSKRSLAGPSSSLRKQNQLNSLAGQILSNHRKRFDPFLSSTPSSSLIEKVHKDSSSPSSSSSSSIRMIINNNKNKTNIQKSSRQKLLKDGFDERDRSNPSTNLPSDLNRSDSNLLVCSYDSD